MKLLCYAIGLIVAGSLCSVSIAQDAAPHGRPETTGELLHLWIGKAHLNPNSTGWGDSGDPEVRITEQFDGTLKIIYTSMKTQPTKTGSEINCDELIEIEVNLAAQLIIQVLDRDVISDDVLLEFHSPCNRLRTSLANGLIEQGGSNLVIKVIDPPGEYEITLLWSVICPIDAKKVGMRFIGDTPRALDYEDIMLHPFQTTEAVWQHTKNFAVDQASDALQHRVIVRVNKFDVFTSASSECSPPTGMYAEWRNSRFRIDWKPGDLVQVVFQDVDLSVNDVVFTLEDSSQSSISVLSGVLRGGSGSDSAVCFRCRQVAK